MSDNNNNDSGSQNNGDLQDNQNAFNNVQPLFDDSAYGSAYDDYQYANAESNGQADDSGDMDSYFNQSQNADPGDEFFGHKINIEAWTDTKEEALKVRLVDFISSMRHGNPKLDRASLLRGLATELEAPYDHKIMSAIHDLGEYRVLNGYNEVVKFFFDLGYDGFPEHDLDPSIDMNSDPGRISAADIAYINSFLPDEIKNDPEHAKSFKDAEISALISEKLASESLSIDEVDKLSKDFSNEKFRVFYLKAANAINSGELPRGHYRYYGDIEPDEFFTKLVDEVKNGSSIGGSAIGDKPAAIDSYSDPIDPKFSGNIKSGFSQSGQKFDGKVNESGSGSGGSEKKDIPISSLNGGSGGQSPGFPQHGAPFRPPQTVSDIIANALTGAVLSPFALMGGAITVFSKNSKTSFNNLLDSKISALGSAASEINSSVDELNSGVDKNGSPLSDEARQKLASRAENGMKTFKNRIRDISEMSSNKHVDEESMKKISDAMEKSNSFIKKLKGKNLESLGDLGKKIKEFAESISKLAELMIKFIFRRSGGQSPSM